MSTEQRPPAAEIELLNLYLDGIDEDYRNQTILRRRITEFFTDEGFFYPIFRQSVDRDRLDVNTFVYKFDIDSQGSKQIKLMIIALDSRMASVGSAINPVYSILTDIQRPLMINSPRPKFAKGIRNDEADFIFKLSLKFLSHKL